MNRLLMILGLIPVIHANAAEPRLPIPQRFGDSHVRHLNGQGDAIGLFWPMLPLRNLFFLMIVLSHGVRRLFPPYS